MKNNIILCFLALLLIQCKEDAITVTTTMLEGNSISGSVLEDTDGDGIGDLPVEKYLVVYGDSISMTYYDLISICRSEGMVNGADEVYFTYTDENGNYVFEDLPPAKHKAIGLCQTGFNRGMGGKDDTPDGDDYETRPGVQINVSLEEGEHDDGNNFVVSNWNGSVKGNVLLDTDLDFVGDEGLKGYKVGLWGRGSDNGPSSFRYGSVVTDENGNFEFVNLRPNKYILVAEEGQGFDVVNAEDDTPDPDGAMSLEFPTYIAVDLLDGESDEDNNFVVVEPVSDLPSIAGFVLDDIDLDGLGDEGLSGHRIELYERDITGVPTTSTSMPIDADNTDENGYFSFDNVPDGDYVLYHIGTGDYPYTCLEGADLSPESGEPTIHPECFFIQVDIRSGGTDEDNVFRVDKQ